MAKIHVDDLLVLNRPHLEDDGSTQYTIRSYTGQDYKDSVQEVIDDNKLGDQFVYMDGDTMYGPLVIDLGIDPLEQENVESLTVYGRTTQTQVVISPVVISEELANASLIFSNTDPFGNKKRDHEVLVDTTLTFRKYEGELENASDVLTLAGSYVYSPVPVRIGTEISTSEALINPDGSAVFESVVIRQTDPASMSEDNLIHKAYVDERLENVEEELISLVTVEKEESFRYMNGNEVSYVNSTVYNWTSIGEVGSALRVSLDTDEELPNYEYVNGQTYTTSSNSVSGQGLTVIVSELNGIVIGVKVDNPGYGYSLGDDATVEGGLIINVDSVSSGTVYDSEEGISGVLNGQFKWELGKGATDETWGEIETLYLSQTDANGDIQDLDNVFPPGHFIDIRDESDTHLEAGEYYGRYEILFSRMGPSLEVTELGFETAGEEDQVGNGYTLTENAVTFTISGSGQGLTIDIIEVDLDTGAITDYVIRNPGVGYEVGDTVEIEGGVIPSVLKVTSIEDTLPTDKENLIIVGVSFQDSNFTNKVIEAQVEGEEDTVITLPEPTGLFDYDLDVKRKILNRPAIDGYFNWFITEGAAETFNNVSMIRYADKDRDLVTRSNLDFPVGSIIQLIDTSDEAVLYAQYKITSSALETLTIADPTVQGAFNTYNYIELGVEVSSVDSDILPAVISGTEFNSTVVVSTPILDEMELETQRVNNKFDTIDDSLVNIRDDIESLENAITAGAQGYQSPLVDLSAPAPGKFYFYKQDNKATAFFNEPGEEVVGVYLTPFDATSAAGRDWVVGLQANESVLITTNIVDDTSATYLIESFDTLFEGDTDEVSHYDLKLQFISGTPHPSTASTADVINIKTRLLNDGISRQEAEESYVSVLGDSIRGDLNFRDTLNDLNVVEVKPEDKIFRVGRTSVDNPFTFKSYGLNTTYSQNDVVYEEVTSTSSTRYTPIIFAAAENNYISGLDTPTITDISYATNVEYVNTYVQEYVGNVVGLVTPASKTKLGPVKLDKASILSQDDDNQLSVRKATVGNGLSNVGVAGYNSSYFTITNTTDADTGLEFSRVNARIISPNSKSGYGMVQIDDTSIKVGHQNQIYVPNATSGTKGISKIVNNTSTSTPSWGTDTYNSIAASARSVYHAYSLARSAYNSGFSQGQNLSTTGTPSVGGIKKSGSTYYLKVS